MDGSSEFDSGPLTWVKGEIDQALRLAGESLRECAGQPDPTRLRFCRTHVHQVLGALAMVGLDGVTQVTESLEHLIRAMEDGRIADAKEAFSAGEEALTALERYLDELVAGEPNQPLRLLPAYRALAAARGEGVARATDLFHPDLGLRPSRPAPADAPPPAERPATIRAARTRFQKGLLAWLKKPDEATTGRDDMGAALAAVEACQENAAGRAFWWIARGFVAALAEPGIAAETEARQLCSRIEQQIRRLLEGSGNVAERLQRDALYYVAQARDSGNADIQAIRAAYHLDSLLPSTPAAADELLLRRLREAATSADQLWNRLCAGSSAPLPGFADEARHAARLTAELGNTDLKRLGQAIGAVGNWLLEQPERHDGRIALEVSTALQLLLQAQANFRTLGMDFTRRVDLLVARLHGCIAATPPEDDGGPLLSDLAAEARRRLAQGRSVKAVQTTLGQIEQHLDAFFRQPADRTPLASIDDLFGQAVTGLDTLAQESASRVAEHCRQQVREFAQADKPPEAPDFEALARRLSLLGFFVDTLPGNTAGFDAFVAAREASSPVEDGPAPTVEAQLEKRKEEILAQAGGLRSAPEDASLREALTRNLQALQKDADLVADPRLGEAAKAALAALSEDTAAVAAALSPLAAGPVDETSAAPPSEPLPSSTDEIDAELLSIFLMEARDVLATLSQRLEALRADPRDNDALGAIRRSVHTLKGSGRMVGLSALGETAWAVEQTLNLWLRQELQVNPELVGMIDLARTTFSAWIEHLESATSAAPDPTPLIALAERLGSAEADPWAAIAIPPPAPAPRAGARIIELPLPRGARQAAVEPPRKEAPPPPEPVLPPDEIDEALLPIFLEEAQDLAQGFGRQLRAWRAAPGDAEPPRALARLLHTFKGSARMAGILSLGEATHALETRVGELLAADTVAPALIDEIEGACDGLMQRVDELRHREPPAAPPAAPPPEPPAEADLENSLRVRADILDQLVNEAGEIAIARSRIEGEMRGLKSSLGELTDSVGRLRHQLREIEIQAESQMQAHTVHNREGKADFDPLELDRFTRFQELTRFLAESVDDVATLQQTLVKNLDDANEAIAAQARLNRSLQLQLMAVRMVPFESQAERLRRVVRQAARETGRQARLEIRGGRVDVDRSVLERMLPALEHMLRNAVTHGLEEAGERQAEGKGETGHITLSLQQEGSELTLTLADDGRGLDRDAIRRRAGELGLLPAGENLDDARLFDLIFQPGFSTASQVTQIAGRGVGMDVARTAVTSLGGRIETESTPGKGTVFRFHLPLTLAVTQALLVRTGHRSYAIPSTMIGQAQDLKDADWQTLVKTGEADWQGNRYPFHTLAGLLGETGVPGVERHQHWLLYLHSGNRRIALGVDELQGTQEVVVKPIGPQLARVAGLAGATVLGDGQVVLILNPVDLVGRVPLETVPTPPPVAEAEPSQPTVLVVDDSLTVRKITGRLLAREGYRVVTANDGTDALEQLQALRPDVVLSDIEMPRMDGFDLLRHLRADTRWQELPVIMITSRTADKHREHALSLGADEYLGKPYDEEQLLRLVSGYAAGGRRG